MKFVIFGAKGQLGREIQQELIKRQLEVHAFSREELDITDFKKVSEVIRSLNPEVIINTSAYNDVDGAEIDKETAFKVNAYAVRNLAELASKQKSILVHFSTDYVFDGTKNKPYTPLDTPNPLNIYGKSKLEGESYTQDLLNRYFLIRLSWVFDFGKRNFPHKLIELTKTQNTIKVATDQISSPTYTKDAAKVIVALILKGKFGLYHLANTGFCSRYEWAETILRALNWKGELIPAKMEDFNPLAKRPKFTPLDSTKIIEETGINLPDWKDATTRFIKELKGD